MIDWDLLEIKGKDTKTEKSAKNFRVRVLGIFYEELIKPWFAASHYVCWPGRPICSHNVTGKRHVYDYVVEKTGRLFVVEAKCYPAYMNGLWKQLDCKLAVTAKNTLTGAFEAFIAKNFSTSFSIRAKNPDGKLQTLPEKTEKMLIWWDIKATDAPKIQQEWGLAELRSVKQMLLDLKARAPEEYTSIVDRHRAWANELFQLLTP